MTNSDKSLFGARRITPRLPLRDLVLSSTRKHCLTLVIAPVGSGKTTLLNQIRDHLNTEDGIGRNAAEVTVVDDFSSRSEAIRSELASQIETRLNKGHRFILASDQRLDRLFCASRACGEVAEFSIEDLALRDTDLDDFLGEDLSGSVTGHTRLALMERTDGWIGAWNILRNLLSKGVTSVELARSFSGRDRDVTAYFDHMVMPLLSPDAIEFLYNIAPHEILSEAYAQAATGRADCATMFSTVVAQCGFLIEQKRDGGTHRLFPLFREYLIGQAKLANPTRYATAARRAAEYGTTQRDWFLAAQLFAEAGESDRTFEILREYADDLMVERGEVHSFRRLLGSLPQEYRLRTSLYEQQALGSLLVGDYGGALAILAQVNPKDEDSRARREAIGICIDFGLERFQEVRAEAPRWLEIWGENASRYSSLVGAALFWSCMAQLDSPGAFNALRVVREALERSHSGFLEGWLTVISATYMFEHGEAAGAAKFLKESIETGVIRHPVNLTLAGVIFEQGQVNEARRLIQLSLKLGTRHTVVNTSLYGWETAAHLAVLDEGLSSALHLLEGIEALAAARRGERTRRMIRLLRATLILQESGERRHPELQSELEEMLNDPTAIHHCPAFSEELRITLARCYAVSGEPRRAILLVQPIQEAARRSHRIIRWGTASLIYAGALARLGELDRGARQAWAALTQMVEGGYLASAMAEHIVLAPFLEIFERQMDSAHAAMRCVVNELSARAGRPRSGTAAEASDADYSSGFVSLTETEKKILALAAQGQSNAEIAASLSIQVVTVKWHLKNVFAKLSVHSRTAAIAQARRQGIVI